MKRTIAILIIIIVSVGVGFAYERISIGLEKRSHPIPEEYRAIVDKYSKEYNVPREIIYSVIKVESGFRSDVVSEAGAIGLMQIMPDTFDWLMTYQTHEKLAHGLLYEPETNIKYGTCYLRYLYYDKFNGIKNWDIIFAAYNAGHNKVYGWLGNEEYIKDNEIVNIPIEETKKYVNKVNKNREVYKRLYFSKK